jgi:aldose 1-epimerase
MKVTSGDFGQLKNGSGVKSFTLCHEDGSSCTLLTYGGTLQKLMMPDRNGRLQDIVLGYDDMAGYESSVNPYHGAIVGRCCNRIGDAVFTLDGRTFQLARNTGRHHLHGGIRGFDKRIWDGEIYTSSDGPTVRFHYLSPDGEENYPGNLEVYVTYTLTAKHALIIRYEAVSDQKTIINLTNHAYFNLAGQGSGTILDHQVQLEADEYTAYDEDCILTGVIAPVAGTALDFREMKPIRRDIGSREPMIVFGIGFDHNYVVRGEPGVLRPCAKVFEPSGGRVMTVMTTSPGIQLYVGNHMKPDTGKNGARYDYRNGLCLETQHYPNAVNIPHFPAMVYEAGEYFRHETVYQFSCAGDQS